MTTDAPLKDTDIHELPFVEIAAAPRYYIGLPIIISVTWDNRSADSEFYLMPPLDLTFEQGGQVSVSLIPTGTKGAPLETGFVRGEEGDPVATLEAREKRRMVCDLSNLGVSFQPGAYALTLTLRDSPTSRASNTVHTELIALGEDDAREADRLRKLGGAAFDTGSWRQFLLFNWETVTVAPTFSTEAREQLALHLFLHRAFWTPAKLAQVDPKPLDAIHGPALDAEVAVLKYELSQARGDHHLAAQRAALLKRFPGLEHRVKAADQGEGMLARYRRACGVESSFAKPPVHWPYHP